MSRHKTLHSYSTNVPLKITKVKEGELRLKLYEMGIFPGQELMVTRKAPFGDPLAIKIGTQTIMLRKVEAELIEIEEIKLH